MVKKAAEANKVNEDVVKDLESQIEAATAALDKKMEAALKHTLDQCQVVSEKFMTVNGFMSALNTIREVAGINDLWVPANASDLAKSMSELALSIKEDIEKASVDEYNDLLDKYVDSNFVESNTESKYDTAREVMVCNLLQEVHTNLVDMIHFKAQATEEIDKLKASLEKEKSAASK